MMPRWLFGGGSPPRAWGACLALPVCLFATRFTPTCVGSMPCRAPSTCRQTVHPHVRGEHGASKPRTAPSIGSPPRAWGACPSPQRPFVWVRFTPTCVGSIFVFVGFFCGRAVHPHVRGEHNHLDAQGLHLFGSPPRAWGAFDKVIWYTPVSRFTPTCVGSMLLRFSLSKSWTVHPHVRGEHEVNPDLRNFAAGSPPRAWGAFPPVRWNPFGARFTPTCVGSILSMSLTRRIIAVHPHVRGEHVAEYDNHVSSAGSPPRAWGA